MAKTDWNINDTVLPDDLNQLGIELNAKETPEGAQAKADAALSAAKSYTDQEISEINVPVTSVNSKIGDVELNASDVGAEPTIVKKSGFNLDKSDSVTSTSTTTLATSRAVKTAMDRADSAFTQVSNGKNLIATAITDMGQSASGSDTHAQLSSKIKDISKDATAGAGDVESGKTFYQGGIKRTGTLALTGNATASQVLTGRSFYSSNLKSKQTGTMPNRGGVNPTITTQSGQYTIPAGYHNGQGKVTAQFTNLVASNVRQGVNIGGVVGTVATPLYLTHNGGSTFSTTFERVCRATPHATTELKITFTLRTNNAGSLAYVQVTKNGVQYSAYNDSSQQGRTISFNMPCVSGDIIDFNIRTAGPAIGCRISDIIIELALTSPLGGTITS